MSHDLVFACYLFARFDVTPRSREAFVTFAAAEKVIHKLCEVASNSVVESKNEGSASLDPVLDFSVDGQNDIADEVGGVAGCGQNTSTLHGLVHGHLVAASGVDVRFCGWLDPDHWCLSKENLRFTLSDTEVLFVPSASFHEHSNHMDAVVWHSRILFSDNFVVKVHRINRDSVLPGVVLKSTCEEAVREEELVDFVNGWNTCIPPLLEESEASLQVLDVASKLLQRWITLVQPHGRDVVGDH